MCYQARKGCLMFFWTEELYSYTKIYDSLSPISRICVDLRIQGRKPSWIALRINKPIDSVKKCLWRSKKRYMAAMLGNKFREPEMIDNFEG